METISLPANEDARIRALYSYDVLDTGPTEAFDRITRIASAVAGAPISVISLVDEDRQWFKSRVGIDTSGTPREVAFCAQAILGNAPLIVPDATKDRRFAANPLVREKPQIRLYAGVPLVVSCGAPLGTLCVIDSVPRELNEGQVSMLRDLAAIAVDELELNKAAATDHLTGAFNRRVLERIGGMELARARREGQYFCFAMLDIDHFKRINDTYGHQAGDAVLKQVADICRHSLRAEDSFFRMGGEEFGLLLPDTGLTESIVTMHRLLRKIGDGPIAAGKVPINVTASIGLTEYWPGEADFDVIQHRADTALYEAKSSGRNNVKLA